MCHHKGMVSMVRNHYVKCYKKIINVKYAFIHMQSLISLNIWKLDILFQICFKTHYSM